MAKELTPVPLDDLNYLAEGRAFGWAKNPDFMMEFREGGFDRVMVKQHEVLGKISANGVADLTRINRALNVMNYAASREKRYDGKTPSAMHQLEVMEILADAGIGDEETYIIAALHDTPEDTAPNKKPLMQIDKVIEAVPKSERSREIEREKSGKDFFVSLKTLGTVRSQDLGKLFGEGIGSALDSLSKVKKINDADVTDMTYLKLFRSFSKDARVILIKLADRLHSMRTIGNIPQIKQEKKAEETLKLYAKIAEKLGMRKWAYELGSRSIEVLYGRNSDHRLRNLLEYTNAFFGEDLKEKIRFSLTDSRQWELFPKGTYRIYMPPKDLTSIFPVGTSVPDSSQIDAMNFIYRQYRENGETVEIPPKKTGIFCDIVLPDYGLPHRFLANTVEFIERFNEAAMIHGFHIGNQELGEAIKNSDNGLIIVDARDGDGRLIHFRFTSISQDNYEEANLTDLFSNDPVRRASERLSHAERKLTGLTTNFQRIDRGSRTSWDIVHEFLRDLNFDFITAVSPKGEEFYFPKGAKLLDYAYATGEKNGNEAVSASVILPDQTRFNNLPLATDLPDNCRVDLQFKQGEETVDEEFITRLDITPLEHTRSLIAERVRRAMTAELNRIGQDKYYEAATLEETPVNFMIQQRGLEIIKNAMKGQSGSLDGKPFLGIRYANPFAETRNYSQQSNFIKFVEDVGLLKLTAHGRYSKKYNDIIKSMLEKQGNMYVVDLDVPDIPGTSGWILNHFGDQGINIINGEVGPDPRRLTTSKRSVMRILIPPGKITQYHNTLKESLVDQGMTIIGEGRLKNVKPAVSPKYLAMLQD